MFKGGKTGSKKKENRYSTKRLNKTVPLEFQLFYWQYIDKVAEEKETKLDYL